MPVWSTHNAIRDNVILYPFYNKHKRITLGTSYIYEDNIHFYICCGQVILKSSRLYVDMSIWSDFMCYIRAIMRQFGSEMVYFRTCTGTVINIVYAWTIWCFILRNWILFAKWQYCNWGLHYSDVIMTTIASQITSLTIIYSIVYSDADQRKHQSSASLAFVRVIHRGPVNSPHKRPVMRKIFPFDDVIMINVKFGCAASSYNLRTFEPVTHV